MNIIFTGGSSFTGYWFIRKLYEFGHTVFATFTQASPEHYQGMYYQRVTQLLRYCTPLWECTFGSESFLEHVKKWKPDVLCHHGADVREYKSPYFQVLRACEGNTHNIVNVIAALQNISCQSVVITGSVFESYGGQNHIPSNVDEEYCLAFSPYGLSKGITSEIFRYYFYQAGISLHKFIIPNPFGPFEEQRFTHYLMETWANNRVAVVKTPDYVRDNIHVDLLAAAYVHYTEQSMTSKQRFSIFAPSQYRERQGDFTFRFAQEMQKHLSVQCVYEVAQQTQFDEPLTRVNTDTLNTQVYRWSEDAAWYNLSQYYAEMYRLQVR